jgi:hypothetical protein
MSGLANVLPFSGERRTVVRSYHGREESRAPARGVAAPPALERAAWAFIRCNGLLDGIERGGLVSPGRRIDVCDELAVTIFDDCVDQKQLGSAVWPLIFHVEREPHADG